MQLHQAFKHQEEQVVTGMMGLLCYMLVDKDYVKLMADWALFEWKRENKSKECYLTKLVQSNLYKFQYESLKIFKIYCS